MATPAAVTKLAREFADKRYKEGKNNDSIFGKWYGMNNQPWCAMFISYLFNQVGAGALVAAQTKKGFASCSAAVSYFKKNKRLVNVAKAEPGDIVFMNFHGSKTAADHVEIVLRNDKKSKVLFCVGGNTVNPDGTGDQANGDGVYYKTRPYRYIVATVRPNWASVADAMIPTEEPAAPASAPAAPAAPKPAAPAAKPAAKTYKVKAGDSYWAIAEKNGLDFKKLEKLNGSKPLKPGDVIKLN